MTVVATSVVTAFVVTNLVVVVSSGAGAGAVAVTTVVIRVVVSFPTTPGTVG